MAVFIPKNIIIESKYTQGKEYRLVSTYNEYQGYYYEMNGRAFAGKEFNVNAIELISFSSTNINPLLTNPSTYVYGVFTKTTKLTSSTIVNTLVTDNDPNIDLPGEETYYAKKLNQIPYSIKKIDKSTYTTLQSDPFYETTVLNAYYSNSTQAERQMPGIKAFLGIQ